MRDDKFSSNTKSNKNGAIVKVLRGGSVMNYGKGYDTNLSENCKGDN
jgi:hypothetical protein